MNVWGHRIYDWDEIVVPNELEMPGEQKALKLLFLHYRLIICVFNLRAY